MSPAAPSLNRRHPLLVFVAGSQRGTIAGLGQQALGKVESILEIGDAALRLFELGPVLVDLLLQLGDLGAAHPAAGKCAGDGPDDDHQRHAGDREREEEGGFLHMRKLRRRLMLVKHGGQHGLLRSRAARKAAPPPRSIEPVRPVGAVRAWLTVGVEQSRTAHAATTTVAAVAAPPTASAPARRLHEIRELRPIRRNGDRDPAAVTTVSARRAVCAVLPLTARLSRTSGGAGETIRAIRAGSSISAIAALRLHHQPLRGPNRARIREDMDRTRRANLDLGDVEPVVERRTLYVEADRHIRTVVAAKAANSGTARKGESVREAIVHRWEHDGARDAAIGV